VTVLFLRTPVGDTELERAIEYCLLEMTKAHPSDKEQILQHTMHNKRSTPPIHNHAGPYRAAVTPYRSAFFVSLSPKTLSVTFVSLLIWIAPVSLSRAGKISLPFSTSCCFMGSGIISKRLNTMTS
jgi:hypothetical protein